MASDVQIAALVEKVSGLYGPSPEAALRRRVTLPIGDEGIRTTTVPPTGGAEVRAWSSSALDTKGFTLHNAFLGLSIMADNLPNDGLSIVMLLEGSFSSPYSELARSLIPYTGVGEYSIPLLANADSLATNIRAGMLLVSLAENVPRRIQYRVHGLLAAGNRF